MVSEDKSFESVDGRRTDDGGFPYYKLPGSLRLRGGLKIKKCFCCCCFFGFFLRRGGGGGVGGGGTRVSEIQIFFFFVFFSGQG